MYCVVSSICSAKDVPVRILPLLDSALKSSGSIFSILLVRPKDLGMIIQLYCYEMQSGYYIAISSTGRTSSSTISLSNMSVRSSADISLADSAMSLQMIVRGVSTASSTNSALIVFATTLQNVSKSNPKLFLSSWWEAKYPFVENVIELVGK